MYPVCLQVTPNVVVEWLTLHIWEVPGSNLGPETGYNDLRIVVFSLSPSRLIQG
jgi:hypothetical protein